MTSNHSLSHELGSERCERKEERLLTRDGSGFRTDFDVKLLSFGAGRQIDEDVDFFHRLIPMTPRSETRNGAGRLVKVGHDDDDGESGESLKLS